VRARQILLVARPRGDEIVLEGSENTVKLQWIFSEVRDVSFRWRALESKDDGLTWELVQEMHAQRAR
jgi:hypothetical protein